MHINRPLVMMKAGTVLGTNPKFAAACIPIMAANIQKKIGGSIKMPDLKIL